MQTPEATEQQVRDYFTAMAAGDLERVAALITPDIVFQASSGEGAGAVLEFSGAAVLLDGLRNILGQLYDPGFGLHPSIDNLLVQGERAAAEVRIRARTASGEPYDNRYAFFFRFRDGLIASIHEHVDTAYVRSHLTTTPASAGTDQKT